MNEYSLTFFTFYKVHPQCAWSCVSEGLHSIRRLLPHSLHLYGFSPVWILSWFRSDQAVFNTLRHVLHTNGVSPCDVFCVPGRTSSVWKLYHTLLTFIRFSPLWILSCISIVSGLSRFFHILYIYRVYVFVSALRAFVGDWDKWMLSHISDTCKGKSPVCVYVFGEKLCATRRLCLFLHS